MPKMSRKQWGDVCLAAICILYAGLIYNEALKIPPAFFDTLGSAAVPMGCAAILVVLSVLLVLQTRKAQNTTPPREEDTESFRQRWDVAVGIVVLASAYLGVMSLNWLGFAWATVGFVTLATLLLGGLRKSTLIIGLSLSALLGFGGQYLFTEILFIDLPV